ncbi:uncharacterized protein YutD [Planifilum fimeticola]|jgi:uncharacterized protein YutD|uniref:Uncharacterized protein YutD n=1 Tax=Planifilum fimeticola TaxID=201975 RepID=A0A2T0LDW7_9BACL|nr:YutD family protein [Planifilum fimeticola]PRX40261.1 uncharacterized protein YutD [Planifilum fimeticola]
MNIIHIQGKTYELLTNHNDAWNAEAFRKRYSDILKKYDYIVGDWGYGQLRLKGFFSDRHPKATRDNKIGYLQEYLNEYCNFGCAYFVLKQIPSKKEAQVRKKSRKSGI